MQHVVIVDQDVGRRGFLYDIFTQMNCEVTTVPSFGELVEWLKRSRPECIIVDVASCQEDAKEVVQMIRHVDSNVTIVALTEEDLQKDTAGDTQSQENTLYFKRDIEARQLISVILRILREKSVVESDQTLALTKSILFIDDEEDARLFTSNYFRRKGYEVQTASNGEEALLKIKSTRPDVVVLDIMMPGMDGLLVLKCIKGIDSSIIVIVVSGAGDSDLGDSALQLGAVKYLSKPFSCEDLEAEILIGLAA